MFVYLHASLLLLSEILIIDFVYFEFHLLFFYFVLFLRIYLFLNFNIRLFSGRVKANDGQKKSQESVEITFASALPPPI